MKDYKIIVAMDIARISVAYAKKMNISEDEALRLFLGSVTYRALINAETGLCYEMHDAIYEMFLKEMKCDEI
jgi:hypothetical protein